MTAKMWKEICRDGWVRCAGFLKGAWMVSIWAMRCRVFWRQGNGQDAGRLALPFDSGDRATACRTSGDARAEAARRQDLPG